MGPEYPLGGSGGRWVCTTLPGDSGGPRDSAQVSGGCAIFSQVPVLDQRWSAGVARHFSKCRSSGCMADGCAIFGSWAHLAEIYNFGFIHFFRPVRASARNSVSGTCAARATNLLLFKVVDLGELPLRPRDCTPIGHTARAAHLRKRPGYAGQHRSLWELALGVPGRQNVFYSKL
jgi:hypothetical protein